MKQTGKILYAEHDGVHFLKFVGDVRLTLGPTISSFIEHLRNCDNFKSMIVDLSETQGIDSTALGLLARVAICTSESFNSPPSVICPSESIGRLLKSMAMDQVCHLVKDRPGDSEGGLAELPCKDASEEDLREEVLQAHKTLMNLDEGNQDKFRNLVEALEEEKASASARRA